MKRYESYKDSGVKWLGEIPGHWEVIRLKALLIERIEKNNNKENLIILSLLKDKGIIPYDEKGAIGNNSKEDLSQYKIARKGDLVINSMNVIIGSVGITQYDGYISPAYYSFKPRGIINLIYYYYLMTLRSVQQSIRCYSKGIMEIRLRITSNDFLSMPFPFPPKSEQTAIANYLNSVTSKIDEAISQQQKMIDLLNERKQIIIQNAVTKGLDPNAKMKDSGVEWIGEIPENWEVKRFRFLFKEKNERNTLIKERKQLQFKMGNIVLKDRQDLTNEMINVISNYNIVKPGHIVLNGLNLNYDFVSQRIALVKERGIITSAYICIESINDINTSYYCYFMKAMDSKKLFHGMGSGIRLTLSYDNLKNLFFPYPSINDQIEIVKYLDSVSSKIDSSISQCNKMISLLQERKQIIINDVVTGKVKVI